MSQKGVRMEEKGICEPKRREYVSEKSKDGRERNQGDMR